MLDADEFNWTLCLPWKNIPTNWSVQARFILWISGLREGSLVDMAVKPTVHKTVKDLRAQQNPRLWIGRVECCCLPLWLILCCFPWTSHCQFLSFKKLAICASIRSISLHQAFNVPTTASPFRQLCQLPRHHVPDGIPRRCWAEGNNMENMDAYCAMTILWHVWWFCLRLFKRTVIGYAGPCDFGGLNYQTHELCLLIVYWLDHDCAKKPWRPA